MSSIGEVNNSLIQSQLDSVQLRDKIAVSVASKVMDVAEMQGQAVLSLLESAAEMAQGAVGEDGHVDLYA